MSAIDEHYNHEGEDSYFVSMTDIMVGMVFVFIILLIYFVFRIQNTSEPMVPLSEHNVVVTARDTALAERDDLIGKLDSAKARIRQLEAEIERLKTNDLDRYLTNADRDRRHILESLQKSMKDAKIDVQIIPDQGILRLPETVLFKSGQRQLGRSARAAQLKGKSTVDSASRRILRNGHGFGARQPQSSADLFEAFVHFCASRRFGRSEGTARWPSNPRFLGDAYSKMSLTLGELGSTRRRVAAVSATSGGPEHRVPGAGVEPTSPMNRVVALALSYPGTIKRRRRSATSRATAVTGSGREECWPDAARQSCARRRRRKL
jgi:hypothetical protein